MWDGKRMWYGTKEEWEEWSEWFEEKTNPCDLLNSLLSGYYDIEFGNEDDKYVWLQSTGLTDKNGREVYEGDVVKLNNKHYLVKWCDIKKRFELDNFDEILNFMEFGEEEIEVVGNIYENPELLEVMKNAL